MRALVIVMLLCGVARADEWGPDGWIRAVVKTKCSEGVCKVTARWKGPIEVLALRPNMKLEISEVRRTVGPSPTEITHDSPLLLDINTQTSGSIMVAFTYATTSKRRLKFEAFAKPGAVSATVAASTAAPATGADDDTHGWTLLGEDDVDLIDDEIAVGRKKSTWKQVKVVVVGDAVQVQAVELGLRGKKAKVQRAALAADLADGESQVIDIAGKRRGITKVRLQYKKHRLDASTRVQVWAR